MAARKVPMRQCVGCREMKEKNSLIRVIRTPEGEILVDAAGKKNGRGAYLCRNGDCLKKAVRSKALSRSLQTEIPKVIYDRLEGEIALL